MKKTILQSNKSIIDFYENNRERFSEEIIILDSSDTKQGKYSYIMSEFSDKIELKNSKLFLNNQILEGDIFENLRKIKKRKSPENYKSEKYFTGGLTGIISYDFNREIEKIPDLTIDDLKLPELVFGIPQLIIVKDEINNKFIEINYMNKEKKWTLELNIKKTNVNIKDIKKDDLKLFKSNLSKEKFYKIVEQAIEYIKAGEIFQVNLSQRFSADLQENEAYELYKILRAVNPSPFASFVKMNDFYLISQSPERLVKIENQKVEERPIAGTRRKKAETEEAMEQELKLNEKERAEHIMLVDLVRNDIGRVCEYGTVKVDELMTIEKYSHVMHIVSNVIGKIDAKKDEFDLIKATFPGGTITGAPKVRTMEIIEELEPTRRGFYTGSIGYIGFDGNIDFNIIIRSFIQKDKKVYFQVGGGIVYDSIQKREYEETINKARAMIVAYKILRDGDENV